jgi:transposase InsO family protein
VGLLRQIEVGTANGKTAAIACKEAGITEQTYYRWRKEYGGLQVDQRRRLKELEQENAKLKRLVAELNLRKWLAATGAKTLYIEPGSPWENGYCESFNSKLRDEFLNGEVFYSMKELRVLADRWCVHYNTVRPRWRQWLWLRQMWARALSGIQ